MKQKKQIMVVEDNRLNREILKEILSDSYSVLEAENGQEALRLLQTHSEDVSLILLDIMMPVMDGFTFLDRIKGDEKLSLIPVIVMTQSDTQEDEVEALAHGATDFVPKPYRPPVILHRVSNLIRLRESAAIVNQFKYDRLTGLYSKDFFYQRVKEILKEDPEGEYDIICSNIENFKMYNDSLGVAAGNLLLKELAKIAMEMTGEDGICGRFGADRFMVLWKRKSGAPDLELLFQSRLNAYRSQQKNVVVKWGVYEVHDRTVEVEQMCDRAFLAADSIKGQFGQVCAWYDESLRNKLIREKTITDIMEAALNEDQFTVYLQPKYSLHNDGLAGAEALVRWIHPEWGFMSPGEFIPLFEKNGFITRLDRYVWRSVCEMLRDWKQKGYPALPVSVNVSRMDIYQSDLVETLYDLVSEHGLEPAQLHLELTESAYTNNPDQIIETVVRLRKLGFVVEMDDFGSGYSSLNMLNQMKLDILKLDMKFIQSETSKPAEQGILQFIVNLARWMNLSVVAEGVETRAQLERLREVGCDYVQGYYFARPMPREEFEKQLESRKSEVSLYQKKKMEQSGRRCLLVVDEDEEYRKRVREAFDSQFLVLETVDANRAVSIVQERGCGELAAVVLSMNLPDSGAEFFLKAVRQDPLLWQIPVVAALPGGLVSEETIENLDTDDFLCKCHPISDLRRRVNRLLSMQNYRKQAQLLQDEACRDYLTGLLNRRGFITSLNSMRQEDLPIAMYLFDVDDLKLVNDRSGHEAGDTMLHDFGELLKRHTRDGDVLCRYGGDEFLVILKHINSSETILRKAEAICREFQNYSYIAGTHASCSAGIVACGSDEKLSAELIDRADEALYRAKRENKGYCCMWKSES